MESFEEFEKACDVIREENDKLLDEFEEWLYQKGFSEKTVDKHRGNTEFYVNNFLLYEDTVKAAEGPGLIGNFLGYWFIRKAMWASKTSIRENAASLKKFYRFMLEREEITEESLEEMLELIKEDMTEWLATLERYDDPEIEDPEEIWFGVKTASELLEETEGENDQMKDLFRAAMEFNKAKCWEWMDEDDIFGVQDPETGMIAYCCIIGILGEVLGLVAYRGSDGLENIFMTKAEELPPDYHARLNCLRATFEDRSKLGKEDLELIKDLGLKFRGRKQWPLFRDFSPGYFPWFLEIRDCRFLTHILVQALEVSLRCQRDKGILAAKDPLTFLVRVPQGKGNALTWRDKYLKAKLPQQSLTSYHLNDQLRLNRMRRLKRAGGEMEADVFFLSQPVREERGERPYFPKACVFVDHKSGLILGFDMVKNFEQEGDKFVDALVTMIENNKKIPFRLQVGSEEAYYLFLDICEQLDIPLEQTDNLEYIERARQQMDWKIF